MTDKFEKFAFENEFLDVVVLDGLVGSSRGANARDEAFREGLAQGRAEAETLLQQETEVLRRQVQALTAKLTAQTEQWQAEVIRHMLTLMRTALHRIVGHAAAHYSDQMLENHIRHLLGLLHHAEHLTLRIHPQAKTYHEKLGLPQASISNIPFRIVTDPTLGITDVVMEWPSGGLEAHLADTLAHVDKLLMQAGADTTLATTPMPATSELHVPPSESISPLDAVSREADARAKALLGDDELVDALK